MKLARSLSLALLLSLVAVSLPIFADFDHGALASCDPPPEPPKKPPKK